MAMKKLTFAVLAAASASAFAQSASAPIPREQYSCAIYICLGDPRGARAESSCVPPINWLYDLLKRRKPFPRCEDAERQGMSVQQVYDYFDPCPAPLVAADAGSYVATGRLVPVQWRGQTYTQVETTSEPTVSEQQLTDQGGQVPSPRACVGNLLGSTMAGDGGGDDVKVYDTVTWLAPASPRAVDLYMNGSFVMRNRY
jgi:hypothetical protein